jgi:hypothetical protein
MLSSILKALSHPFFEVTFPIVLEKKAILAMSNFKQKLNKKNEFYIY